ncbi:hypothetical protein [Pseudomonas sp. SC3(2021)]|uniref:hypothetical protein n=1 Tax=Pseudomonas sp. SC3(2021) TaxID=2871493 RepID=UPI001C9E0FEC|nr:hypothetical protein [Pseudomonas sp. SC3(2021)]
MSEESNFHEDTWSANDEMFNCDSLNELLNENDNLAVGDIIEMLGERAYDDVGEVAEDWPDVSAEARQELDAILGAWVSKHCAATF